MILAGLQKISLIDYPGKVSCVAFISGCNFQCPYCHNPELAQGRYPERIDEAHLLKFLQQRRTLLDGVVISGGEPTLSPYLNDLCRAIRRTGLAIKLDTNGSRPDVLKQLIDEGLVDYIAMDIKTDPAHYGAPFTFPTDGALIQSSIRIVRNSPIAYEFRTTCVRPFIDETRITQIAQAIQGARQYMLQKFQSATMLDPNFGAGCTPGFSTDAMEHLRTLVLPWVPLCRIR